MYESLAEDEDDDVDDCHADLRLRMVERLEHLLDVPLDDRTRHPVTEGDTPVSEGQHPGQRGSTRRSARVNTPVSKGQHPGQ